jgi:transposase
MSTSSGTIIYTGLDVHKDSITAACFEGMASEPFAVDRLSSDFGKLRRYVRRLERRGHIRACYEASGAGYVLHRELTRLGVHCDVIAPSLTPVRPGEHRKFDKRDAVSLARYYRSGELVTIRVPDEPEERVRDLVRCRRTFQREILRARHYVVKFLARRGFVYRNGSHWTRRHRRWLEMVLREGDLPIEDRIVFGEYLSLLDYELQRRNDLDQRIETLSTMPPYHEPVGRLRCFRGIETLAAMTLQTELGDWRRFQGPRHLMAFVGLVPSEHSSGERQRLGAITKAGNSTCRHVLVQAAWKYRHRPAVGKELRTRQEGQPPHVIAHAWKAQHRLYKVYHRLAHRRCSQIAAVAVARELVGFLWAAMIDLEGCPTMH